MKNGQHQAGPHDGNIAAGPEGKTENPKARLILDAALKLFCDKGYDVTSTDEIARAAGVSKATVYAHFKGKEALLRAVIEDRKNAFRAQMESPLALDPRDVVGALRQIAEKQAAILLTPCDFAFQHLVETQAARFPEIGRMFWEAGAARILAEVTAVLQSAIEAGELTIPDPDLAAVQFISLVRGDVPFLRRLLPDLPVEDKLRKQIEGALHLFLAAYKSK